MPSSTRGRAGRTLTRRSYGSLCHKRSRPRSRPSRRDGPTVCETEQASRLRVDGSGRLREWEWEKMVLIAVSPAAAPQPWHTCSTTQLSSGSSQARAQEIPACPGTALAMRRGVMVASRSSSGRAGIRQRELDRCRRLRRGRDDASAEVMTACKHAVVARHVEARCLAGPRRRGGPERYTDVYMYTVVTSSGSTQGAINLSHGTGTLRGHPDL